MTGICEGRVALVTGAGRGLGRAHALELARQGARVIVNDLGCELDGTGGGTGPAGEVVEEIRAAGGEALANGDDVSDFAGAGRMVAAAVDGFGRIDVVVNNAGFVRDRMFANVAEDEWDAVVRVHLKGHFAVARHAAAWWRDEAKGGRPVDGRIINTSSGAGILGSVGQAAYSAAKAGIATLTLVQAAELGPLRRHRQRPVPGRPHPHDRGGLHRDDGHPRRARRLRRHGTRERLARWSPGSRRPTRQR